MPTTRMPFEDRSVQLLDIAEELFTTKGYEQVSVEDIARAAGVSRPVVYQHHHSKEHLFLECARRARDEFEQGLRAAHEAAAGDVTVFIEHGSDMLFDLLFETPSRWALMFSSALGENGELAVELTRLRFSTVEKLAELAGTFAPEHDPERLMALANAISGMSEAFCRWAIHSPELPRERIMGYQRQYVGAAVAAVLAG